MDWYTLIIRMYGGVEENNSGLFSPLRAFMNERF